jgi:hypothetical protein
MKSWLKNSILALGLASSLGSSAQAGVPPKGLIGYWQGNGNADDSSTLGNNGSFSGSYAKGHKRHTKAFDLSTRSVSVPNITAYDLQKYKGWTVGFWFNTNGQNLQNNNATFLGDDDGSGCQNKWFVDYGYAPGPVNAFVLHLNTPDCLDVFLQSDAVSIPSGWNQLTVVRHASDVVFYLNGQSIGTVPYAGITPYPSAPLSFGALEPCCNYSGLINDVVLYRRALTATQVQKLATP